MKARYKVVMKEDYAEVILSNGTVTKVDVEDLRFLKIFPSWQVRRGYIGCERWIRTKYGKVLQRIYLHRLVTNPVSKWQVDHANRDKKDNRKKNLRMATASQNGANKIATRSSTGYRGVTDTKRSLKKRFVLNFSGKNYGLYYTPEEAARAYDKMAKEKYGPFAVLNFPEEHGQTRS